jgi:hypothetical protein
VKNQKNSWKRDYHGRGSKLPIATEKPNLMKIRLKPHKERERSYSSIKSLQKANGTASN